MPFFLRLSLVLSLIFAVYCPSKAEAQERVYHYPLRYEVDTLDPVHTWTNSSFIVINQVFDGLVQFDKDLNILPAIAESWIISEGGRLYTFFIRKGVRFHNGREVKAEDVAYSIERGLKTKGPGAAQDFLRKGTFQIERIQAIDDYILEISLKEPYAPTLTILALAPVRVVPREEVEKGGFGSHPVGTGAFKFKSWKGREIVLEANPDYFEGKPYLDKLIYRVFPGPDDKGILRAFMKGELEGFTIPPLSGNLETLKEKGVQIIRRPMAKLHLYAFNPRYKPFDIKGVRQAIYYAIDRERIVREAVDGRFPVANGIVPRGIPGYTPELKCLCYDPDKAGELLKEAGYPGGKGIPPIELWTASKSAAARREMAVLKENLSAIGLKLKVRYAPWPRLDERIRDGRVPAFRYAFYMYIAAPDAFFSFLFDSKGVNNYTFYSNPEVDRLINKASKEMDMLKRAETYREVERMIIDDAPVIPILFYTYEQALQPYVKGFEPTALGEIYIPMKKVWFEED